MEADCLMGREGRFLKLILNVKYGEEKGRPRGGGGAAAAARRLCIIF